MCCFLANEIVWMKQLEILLPVHLHSIAFQDVIALYYFITFIHTTGQSCRFSDHLPAKTRNVLPFLNVKWLVYKSCKATFCRRGYGLKENDSSIYFCRITIPAIHASDLKGVTTTWLFQKQNKWYLQWITPQRYWLHVSVETAIEHDYRNGWPIVVTCYSR